MKPPCSCDGGPGRCDSSHCDSCVRGGPYDASQCRVCWLYHNSAEHRLSWAGPAGVAARARNFLAASAGHLLAGLPVLTDEEYGLRMDACRSCDAFEAAADSCKVCGCRLSVKARWAEQDCPLGKWVGSAHGVKEGSEGG